MGGSEGGRKGVGRKEMMERGMQRPAVGGGVQHQLLGWGAAPAAGVGCCTSCWG